MSKLTEQQKQMISDIWTGDDYYDKSTEWLIQYTLDIVKCDHCQLMNYLSNIKGGY